MAEPIQIPTYTLLSPNSVYTREVEPIELPMLGETPSKQLLLLLRYTCPSKEQAIELIQAVAKNPEKYPTFAHEIPMAKFLKELPAEEIRAIKDANPKTLEHLAKHFAESNDQPGRDYLRVISGIVPNALLERVNGLSVEEKVIIYEGLVNRAGQDEWHLVVRLEEAGLPKKEELEFLLQRGVRDSDVFRISGEYGDYKQFAERCLELYPSLAPKEKMANVRDVSNSLLRSRAAQTLKGVAECFQKRRVMLEIGDDIGEALKGAFGKGIPKKGDMPPGFPGFTGPRRRN